VEKFEEFPHVLLAVVVTVWLIEQLKGLDENLKAFLDDRGLHSLVAEELLEDLDRGNAEVSVTKRNEQVVLET
jgi:hypothetical protein